MLSRDSYVPSLKPDIDSFALLAVRSFYLTPRFNLKKYL